MTSAPRSSERLRAVIEASPDPILVFAEDSTVQLWNPAAEEKFGYPAAEVVGRRFTDLDVIPEDGRDAFEDRLARAFDGETFDGVEVERFGRDGERIHLSLSKAPMRDVDGTVTGVVTVKKDISEQKRLEAKLREENERLEKFASIVSHDLRNPLMAAMANRKLAQERGDDAYFQELRDAHDRMLSLIEDLLTLAREGVAEEDLAPVDLGECARECWDYIDPGAATLAVESGAPVVADPAGLRRVVDNLLRNAIEHGGDGVAVTVGDLDEGTGFFVEDDGPGIPADRRDLVFEVGNTTREGGAGVGLRIVGDVATAHGWRVRAREGAAGGARFEVSGVERGT